MHMTTRLMAGASFAHVDTWIFDLDDTLYPASAGLHERMVERVVLFLSRFLDIDLEEAARVHKDYYQCYGATLQALVQEHRLDPAAFLEFVHDIDVSGLGPDQELARGLAGLPGRKVVFTNGSLPHAKAVLGALGISSHFEAICHIERRGYIGKPNPRAYEILIETETIDARSAAMFDDRADNLVVPHRLGMRTIHVVPDLKDDPAALGRSANADAITSDLAHCLQSISGLLARQNTLAEADPA